MADKPKPKDPNPPTGALVVVEPFADYRRGDRITDPSDVQAVLASENSGHVRAIALK